MSAGKVGDLPSRLGVALVGVPTVLALLWFGGWPLVVPLALIAWMGAREVYRIARQRGVRPFEHLGGVSAALLVLLAERSTTFAAFAPWGLGVLLALTASVAFAALALRGPDEHPLAAMSITVFGAVYAGMSLACIPLLHALPEVHTWGTVIPVAWGGLAVVALPLAATWIGDAVAFFAGTKWGRAKILPKVSPNKSWVGSWSGLAAAAGSGAVWFWVVDAALPGMPVRSVLVAAGLGALLGVGAQLGDFVESLLKREAGVKDSGTFFRGHGGVLDRLDALVVTLPLAFVALAFLEHVS